MKKIKLFALVFIVYCFSSVSIAHALSVEVYVPEKYTVVEAGERFYFEIDIKYPENPKRKDLRMIYQVKKDDELVAESKFLKAVETQASFMDFIVMPENVKKGLYHINVVVSDYEDLKEEVSASFQIIESKKEQIRNYFLILLGAVLVMGILIMVEIFIVNRWSRIVGKIQ